VFLITNADLQKYAKIADAVTAVGVIVTAISPKHVLISYVKIRVLLRYVALILNALQLITRAFVAVLKAIPEIRPFHAKLNKKNVMSIMIADLLRYV
jgi:hypothetical protein